MTRKCAVMLTAAIIMTAVMAGCTPRDTARRGAQELVMEFTGLPETLDNPNITIIYWRSERSYLTDRVRAPNMYDAVWETKPYFEAKYGGTVTVEFVDWGMMIQRMVELQNAGAAPDLIMVYDRVMHNMIFSGSIMPLTDFVTDADYAFWDVDRDLFSWRDTPYAIPWKPYLTSLVFNRDLLELYGLEMPDELYRRGEWTFDKFREMVMRVTSYTDGEADYLGYGSWTGEGMGRLLLANGAAFIDIDTPSGRVTSGFDNPVMLDTLDWMRTLAGGSLSGWARDTSMYGYFDHGGLAFIDGKEYGREEFPFEVGVVPYPRGPNSPVAKPIVVMPQGMAVPTGARNPEAAVVFMRMLNQHWSVEGNRREAAMLGQENFDMIYNDSESTMVYAFDKAVSNIDVVTATIANFMGDNTPASTIAETLSPELRAAIQVVYSGR